MFHFTFTCRFSPIFFVPLQQAQKENRFRGKKERKDAKTWRGKGGCLAFCLRCVADAITIIEITLLHGDVHYAMRDPLITVFFYFIDHTVGLGLFSPHACSSVVHTATGRIRTSSCIDEHCFYFVEMNIRIPFFIWVYIESSIVVIVIL